MLKIMKRIKKYKIYFYLYILIFNINILIFNFKIDWLAVKIDMSINTHEKLASHSLFADPQNLEKGFQNC